MAETDPQNPNPENKEADSVVVAPPSGPTNEELIAALERERYEKQMLANQNAEILGRQMTQRQNAPEPPAELDMKKLGEDLLVNPDFAVSKLNQFVDRKVQGAIQQTRQEVGQYVAQQANANRVASALQSVTSRYPDLATPEGQARLMGKATEVTLRSQQQGLGTPPVEQILESAVRELKVPNNRPATPPPVLEGGSNPSMGQNLRPEVQPEQNPLERHYKVPAGSIVMQDDMENFTNEYVKDMNTRGANRGARSKISQIAFQISDVVANARNKAGGRA